MPIEIGSIKLFSVEELASKLHVSQNTIRIYLREEKLKGKKFGVKWYVPEENLKEYFFKEQDS